MLVTLLYIDVLLACGDAKQLREIDLSREGDLGHAIPGQTVSQSLAVDYDPTEDMIYWSAYQSKTISRARRSGTGVWIFIRGHDTWKNTKIWIQMMLLASFVLIVLDQLGQVSAALQFGSS